MGIEAEYSRQLPVLVPEDDLLGFGKAQPFGWFGVEVDDGVLRKFLSLCVYLPVDVLLGVGRDEVEGCFPRWQQLGEVVGNGAAVEFAVFGGKVLAFPGHWGGTNFDGTFPQLAPVLEADGLAEGFGELPVQEFFIGEMGGEGTGARG